MQPAKLPHHRREIKVSTAMHFRHHERSHYRRTAKKKQIAATSRKGLEPRRRSGVGFGRDSNAGDFRRIESGELDWMEFREGRIALGIDGFGGKEASVLIGEVAFGLRWFLTWMIPTVHCMLAIRIDLLL